MSAGQVRRPWRRGAVWLACLAPLFYLTYGVANSVAAGRADVPALVFGWEHHIPFIAWSILPYWSVNAFYAASLFVCRDRHELDAHGRRLLAAQIVAVTFFMLTPLAYTFVRPATDGLPGFLFAALTSFDKPFNQAPSLHIALMIILWSLYTRLLAGPLRWLFHGWFFLIGVSVLTTYQHHFIDIPTGLWLGWLCVALFPLDAEHRDSGWWSWRFTREPRLRQLAWRYAAGGALLALPGVALIAAADASAPVASSAALWAGALAALAGLLLCWSALALWCVAAIYLGGDARKFQKNARGRISVAVRWLLGPYLLAAWLNSRWWTRRAAPHAEVASGVWLSRVPRAAQLHHGKVSAVVDLIAELPLPTPGIHSVRLPVLDLTVPPVALLREAALAIERLRAGGPVWVCCALGYSRSASAVAAWLLHSGRAQGRAEAERLLRAARPQVVLSAAHWAAIEQAARPS